MKIVTLLWGWWSGKSTQAKNIKESFWFPDSIQYTTRPQRNADDDAYRFIDLKTFIEKLEQGCLQNIGMLDGHFYWFDKKSFEWPRILLPSITPSWLIDIHHQVAKESGEILSIFLLLEEDKRRERMLWRWDTKELIEKRIQWDKKTQIYWPRLCDHIINTEQSIENVFNQIYPIVNNFLEK